MTRKLRAMILCLVCVALPIDSAVSASTRTNVFLEMMLAMMEIMGMINRDRDNYYSQPYPVITPGYNDQWQNAMQMLALQQMLNGNAAGMNPLMGMNNLSALNGLPLSGNNSGNIVPFLPDLPTKTPATQHWIEGKWRSSDGMIMEVRQGQFKMYFAHTPQEVRGGLIRIKDQWLAIYERSRQITRQYEFAYKDNRLVLKDPNGNMMLFKRMTNWAVPAMR